MEKPIERYFGWIAFALTVLTLLGTISAYLAFFPRYNVWAQEMEGRAELSKAEYSKQVAVQTAKAKDESAKYLAQAEVTRAEGVAKANSIIGESLKNNEAYLRWLYIEGLNDKDNHEIIYIPTEAGLPILEAGKRTTTTPTANHP